MCVENTIHYISYIIPKASRFLTDYIIALLCVKSQSTMDSSLARMFVTQNQNQSNLCFINFGYSPDCKFNPKSCPRRAQQLSCDCWSALSPTNSEILVSKFFSVFLVVPWETFCR